MSTTIVWFRRDLRLADNPALTAAAERGVVVPVFIWTPTEESAWSPGAASRWWLHQSLASLREALRAAGSRLILKRGPSQEALWEVIRQVGADAVYWNRAYEPTTIPRDMEIKAALESVRIQARSFKAALLLEPGEVATKAGSPYKVFTPFWNAYQLAGGPPRPIDAPGRFRSPKRWPASRFLRDLELEPRTNWAQGLRDSWQPGEAGAHALTRDFVGEAIDDYADQRDLPGVRGTSRLSPHLHFGEISSRQVWNTVREARSETRDPTPYLRQLVWREFAHHMLFNFPATADAPLQPGYARFPWRQDESQLRAWKRGQTGYPIVDAGMRELWHTGWMHNRVRMVVASFLVKDLLINWQEGARWFWDTLVDADLANNTLGWQWAAGCGADAAPFFRVFNPILQGRKFDAQGDYVRKWVPELSALPDKHLHAPWLAPPKVLSAARVELGASYPEPIVDHAAARRRALDALASVSSR